jgi:hypothetical protein
VLVTAREGSPLLAEWSLEARPEVCVTVTSPAALAAAQNRAISAEFIAGTIRPVGQYGI